AGQLHAAEVTPGNPLPALHDVRAEFELDETGQLTTRVIDATVAGGKLLGQADLDAIAPPGLLSFDGEVEAAVLGKLIGGFMADPDSEILGVTALDLDLGLDLSGELDASALRGGLSILSTEVDLPGWDLENAVREGVEAKLASLGALQDLLGDRDDTPSDDSEETADETGEPPLIDQLAATIAFGSMPWEISHLLLAAGDLISEGRGTFDPLQDHLDLAIVAKFSPERSARWLEEYGELEALQDSEGRISLPVLIQGSVVAPDVSVDASQLRKSKRKQLKKKLLERLLR
ncbi:MAG: hypothetical protein OEV00_03325, partial [Acidobacteriota bacterium]|nr:hypothetical protein [Acidobacteriota bacterium]